MQPDLLMHSLNATPFKQLTAILAAHNLQRAAKDKKVDVIEQLHGLLTNPNILSKIIAQLPPEAKEALHRLLTAEGSLPVHTFEERYGPIRPYRPWRKDEDAGVKEPWLTPISVTERLWYLGLIYKDPPKPKAGTYQYYILPTELLLPLSQLLGREVQDPESSGPVSGILRRGVEVI